MAGQTVGENSVQHYKSIMIYGKVINLYKPETNKDLYEAYEDLYNLPIILDTILQAEKELAKEEVTFENAVKKLSLFEEITSEETLLIKTLAAKCFDAEKNIIPKCQRIISKFEKCVRGAAIAVIENRKMEFEIEPLFARDLFQKGIKDAKNVISRWIKYLHTLVQHEIIMKLMMETCDQNVSTTIDLTTEATRKLAQEYEKIEKMKITEDNKNRLKKELKMKFDAAQREWHREIDLMTEWKKMYQFYNSLHHLERSMKKNQRIFKEPTCSAKYLAMIYLETQCESIPKAYFKVKEMKEELGFTIIMTPQKSRLGDLIFHYEDFVLSWKKVIAEVWDTNGAGNRQDVKKELQILCQHKLHVLKSECHVEENPTPQKKIKDLTDRISFLEKQVEELDFPSNEPKDPASERITPPKEKPVKKTETPDPVVMNRLNVKSLTLAKTKLEVLNIIMQSI